IRRLFKKVPLLLPKSISQSSPTFCRWMRACRRDTLGESRTIVFAAVRPTEQLPRIGWHVPSAASNQAPSSGGAFTRKEAIKSNTGCKSIRDVLKFGWANVKMAIVGTALLAFNFLTILVAGLGV